MTRLVRWTCPTADAGHVGVLAPSRPRKDDVRRFCLECSRATGRLVARVPPALERQREVRRAREVERLVKKAVKERERDAAYYTVAGVNLYEEMLRMIQAKVFVGTPLRHRGRRPTLIVRRRSSRPTRFGFAHSGQWRIIISAYPSITEHDVRETLCHELAHLATPYKGHGVAWKTMFRLAAEETLGVRPRIEKRFHGEVTRMLVAVAASESEPKDGAT
jgi:hypothetical protein